MTKSKWEHLHAELSTLSQSIKQYKMITSTPINFYFDLLLFGPFPEEYWDYQNEFSNENPIDKMHPLYQEGLEEEKILANLAEPVEKFFRAFLKNTILIEESKQLLPFRPLHQASIKTALEILWDCKKNRKFGPYDLFKEWKKLLQSLIFQGTRWSKKKQEACLLRMRRFYNKKNYEKSVQHESVLCYNKTAGEIFIEVLKREVVCFDKSRIAMIIQRFLEKFISDHNDKKSGQIVCILWLLVRLSHEMGDDVVVLEEIICLSSKQITISNNNCLLINKIEIKASRGLMSLLSILIGKGKGIRNCRLFPDINKRNFKYALQKAFKELFPNEAPFFTLSSLLFFPHEFSGVKIPAPLLKKMKNPDAYAGKPGDLKVSLLKGFKS